MFDISKVDDVSILHLCGEITLLELELIQKIIASFRNCQYNKIVIDLANVDHLHFQAFKKWAEEALSLRNLEGDLKLATLSEQTRQMMRFTGADQFLEDFASSSEAVLSFLKFPGLNDRLEWSGNSSGTSESTSRWHRPRGDSDVEVH